MISSPVVGLLPIASGQAFNSISCVDGGMVIPSRLGLQNLVCKNRMYHWKVEVGIKIGEAVYCASLSRRSLAAFKLSSKRKSTT
jgi:hypothetical protein